MREVVEHTQSRCLSEEQEQALKAWAESNNATFNWCEPNRHYRIHIKSIGRTITAIKVFGEVLKGKSMADIATLYAVAVPRTVTPRRGLASIVSETPRDIYKRISVSFVTACTKYAYSAYSEAFRLKDTTPIRVAREDGLTAVSIRLARIEFLNAREASARAEAEARLAPVASRLEAAGVYLETLHDMMASILEETTTTTTGVEGTTTTTTEVEDTTTTEVA